MGRNLPRACAQRIAPLRLPVMWTVCLSRRLAHRVGNPSFLYRHGSSCARPRQLYALTVHNVFPCYISSAYSLT
jgi:hypothetical protein